MIWKLLRSVEIYRFCRSCLHARSKALNIAFKVLTRPF
jgi:hypothetical protein